MSGLERIIAQIDAEAASEAEKMLSDANTEAKRIMDEAKAEADAKTVAMKKDSDDNVAEVRRSRESAAGLLRRQRALAQKQMLLEETLEKALNALYDLPDAKYFELLAKLVANEAEPQAGEMFLSEKDKARMPKGFEKDLQKMLPKGGSLVVAQATKPLDGGFVLKYGDIEQNASFKAIFAARADEFSDLISGTLFN